MSASAWLRHAVYRKSTGSSWLAPGTRPRTALIVVCRGSSGATAKYAGNASTSTTTRSTNTGPCSWVRRTAPVTTPKHGAQPRTAHHSSASSPVLSSLRWTMSPLGSTMSTSTRWSMVSPRLRVRYPMPPRVTMPIPGSWATPTGMTRPDGASASNAVPTVAPPPTRTEPCMGSAEPRWVDRSIIAASSATQFELNPPPRTVTRPPDTWATRSVREMSSTSRGWTTHSGMRREASGKYTPSSAVR